MEKNIKGLCDWPPRETAHVTYFRLALFQRDSILFSFFTEDVRRHSLSEKNQDFYTRIYGYSI